MDRNHMLITKPKPPSTMSLIAKIRFVVIMHRLHAHVVESVDLHIDAFTIQRH